MTIFKNIYITKFDKWYSYNSRFTRVKTFEISQHVYKRRRNNKNNCIRMDLKEKKNKLKIIYSSKSVITEYQDINIKEAC